MTCSKLHNRFPLIPAGECSPPPGERKLTHTTVDFAELRVLTLLGAQFPSGHRPGHCGPAAIIVKIKRHMSIRIQQLLDGDQLLLTEITE
jgi:hypothetical protein